MRVENIMARDVRSCTTGDTLRSAARAMWEGDCGCVPVVDDKKRVLGMLTDRDICMSACLQQRAPHGIRVTEPMSKMVFACEPTDTLEQAEALMRTNKIRRLPVVDSEQRLVGMLSLNDIAREAERERKEKKKTEVSDAEVRETLAAVCQPRVLRAV